MQFKEFVKYNENTMDHYTLSSVAKLIIRLHEEEKLLNNFIEPIINTFIKKVEDFSELPEFKEQKSVIKFMQKRFKEPPDDFDKMTYYDESGKEIELQVMLSETFALVCRVILSNKSPYGNDEIATKIWKDGLLDRVKILYDCCLNLYHDSFKQGDLRCHQGARHMIAMTLCQIHPLADNVIIHLQSFLQRKVTEYVATVFKKIPVDKQFECVKNIIFGNQDNDLALNLNDQALKEYLKKVCIDCGLNTQEQALEKEIQNIIASKDYVVLLSSISDLNMTVYYLQELKQILDNHNTDKEITIKVNELLQSCQKSGDLFEKGLCNLVDVRKFNEYVQEFEFIFLFLDAKSQLKQDIENTVQKASDYYQNFQSQYAIQSAVKQQLLDEINKTKEQIAEFKNKMCVDDIVNFFAIFNSDMDEMEKFTLCHNMQQKRQFIVFANDNELINTFYNGGPKPGETKIKANINSYFINRILLQAILTFDEPWSKIFHSTFNGAVSFLLRIQDKNIEISDIKKASYPKKLLRVLSTLKVNAISEHIKDADNWLLLLQLLPNQKFMIILNQIKDKIKDMDDLVNAIIMMPKQYRVKILSQINQDGVFLKTIIKNGDDLGKIVNFIPGRQLINLLFQINQDGEFLKNIIKNEIDLTWLIIVIPKTQRVKFLFQVDQEFLKTIINCVEHLDMVIDLIPEQQRVKFLLQINQDGKFLKSIIKSAANLILIVNELMPEQCIEFLSQINQDGEFLKSIIKSQQDAVQLINLLPERDQLNAVELLGLGEYYVKKEKENENDIGKNNFK